MKNLFSSRKSLALIGFALLLVSDAAFAQQTAGDVAKGVFDQMKDFADVATAGAFLAGIVVGITALFKFKAYSENPQQNKVAVPIILAMVAAGLIGLPAFLNMSKDTVLDGTGNSLDQGVYNDIGG